MPKKKTCPDYITKNCEYCKKDYQCRWDSRKKQRYCSKVCASADPSTKKKIVNSQNKTFSERYGRHPMKTEITKGNLKKVFMEKYGVDWNSKISDHVKKVKRTKLDRYGDENYINVQKIKETHLKRYGVDNPRKLKSVKEKSIETLKKNHFYNELLPILESKNLTPLFTFQDYEGNNWKVKYKFQCKKCDHTFQYSLYHKPLLFCPKCSQFGKNKPESEMFNFLCEHLPGEDIKIRDRTVLSGKELDFYIPKLKFALEHDGLYWHRELKGKSSDKNQKYKHLNKLKSCAFHGIDLIRIFEDEWRDKKGVVKSILTRKLFPQKIKTIDGSGLYTEKISKEKYSKFVDENSLKISHRIPTESVGVYSNGDLVCVVGYTKKKSQIILEGIFQKNGAYVYAENIKSLNILPNGIIKYYLDRRVEDVSYFLSLGFKISNSTEPNWYLLSDDFKFRIKDTTCYRGNKIWDCGYLVLELNPSP
jgi:very-short-patch-repair endonuclease